VANVFASISEINQHYTWLVLGWVTVRRRVPWSTQFDSG